MPLLTPTLDVDLSALCANYRLLKQQHVKQSIGAVVKANAYGLGVEAVADALWEQGCRMFFVATLAEGIALRKQLPDARIAVFNGLLAKEEKKYLRYRLTPVLNDPGQVERWEKSATPANPAILHVDTGMTRLGLTHSQLEHVAMRHHSFVTHSLAYVMSHLACANEPCDPKNAEQLSRFHSAMKLLPGVKGSLSNSSGLFLSPDFHADLGRPGCALYGINPTHSTNPMQHVATLSAPLLQIRTLDRDEAVGYGSTYKASKGSRIAITALGYADGWLRSLSNTGFAYVAGHKAAIAGRVSMDMIALDVSAIPDKDLKKNVRAEFINAQQTVDDVADACGTIGYEIFTRLGRRVVRNVIGS